MFNLNPSLKIYLATGFTDMRKGIYGLSLLAQEILKDSLMQGALFVFRGRRSDRIKILWWDGQGFCLYYKCLEKGKFPWPRLEEQKTVSLTKAQLSMLIEGIDWRQPRWSDAPQYIG